MKYGLRRIACAARLPFAPARVHTMTQHLTSDDIARRITQLADLIFVACKSDEALSLELCIAAMGFAARELSATDMMQHGGDPRERMAAIKGLFNAAFEHEMAETIATVETQRAIRRMTGQQ